jgi:Lipocalin-like domain
MNRRTTFTLRSIFILSAFAALGLALLPGSIVAQQGTLKQQLVSTWTIVSYGFTLGDGTKRQIANPKGILIFDAGGRYAVVIGRADRPKFKSASQPTTEELAAATADFFAANAGTWSISEADKILTQRFDAALRPDVEGTDVKWSVSLVGDELKLTGVAPLATGARLDTVYRRAR